jgi:hypothetical protein
VSPRRLLKHHQNADRGLSELLSDEHCRSPPYCRMSITCFRSRIQDNRRVRHGLPNEHPPQSLPTDLRASRCSTSASTQPHSPCQSRGARPPLTGAYLTTMRSPALPTTAPRPTSVCPSNDLIWIPSLAEVPKLQEETESPIQVRISQGFHLERPELPLGTDATVSAIPYSRPLCSR